MKDIKEITKDTLDAIEELDEDIQFNVTLGVIGSLIATYASRVNLDGRGLLFECIAHSLVSAPGGSVTATDVSR